MNYRRIAARALVLIMVLSAVTPWVRPQNELAAQVIQARVGQMASETISRAGVNITNAWFDMAPEEGVSFAVGVQGGSAVVTVFAESGTHGQSFARTLNLMGTMGDDNLPWSEQVLIAVNVTDVAQDASLRVTAPDRYIVMRPGVPQLVTITVRNDTAFQARNVTIVPTASADFTMEVLGNVNNVHISGNGQRDFQVRITPHASVTQQTLTVPFNIRFENNLGNALPQVAGNIVARIERTPAQEPRVILESFTTNPAQIEAGDDFVLTAVLHNITGVAVNNVQITVGGLGTAGLTLRGTNSLFVGTIGPNSQTTVSFDLSARSNLASGAYPVEFTMTHDNAAGETRTERVIYNVAVSGEEEEEEDNRRARLVVTNITAPTANVGVGSRANVQVTVANTGDREAENVRLTATPEAGIVPVLASIQTLQTLAVGQSHTFEFAFSPTNATTSRFYNIGFEIAFDTGARAAAGATAGTAVRDSFSQFTGFNVYNPDDDDAPDRQSVPRIIISDYTVQPLMVMANSEFDLSMTFMNTHSDRAIGNIIITWTVTGAIGAPGAGTGATTGATFTPVGASNTIFIDHIPPNGTVEHHLRLFAVPDAAPGNHTIAVSFAYEDMEANPFTSTANIGVNVRQESRLALHDISVQEHMTMGMPSFVTLRPMNEGRTEIFNLRVWVEAEGFDVSAASEIYGRWTSGQNNFFWGSITPMMPGPAVVRVMASFEDAMGDVHTIYYDFNVNVMGMDFGGGWDEGDFGMRPPFPGDNWWDDEDESGGLPEWLTNPWVLAGGGGAVLLAGGITLGVLLRRKRNKELNSFGDDDNFFDN